MLLFLVFILGLLRKAVELRQWVEPFYLTCGDVVNNDNIDLGLTYSWRNAIIDKNAIHSELFEQFQLYSLFLSNIQIVNNTLQYKIKEFHFNFYFYRYI